MALCRGGASHGSYDNKKKKKKYLITVKLLMVLEMLLRDIAFKRAQGGDFFSKCKEGGRV